MPTVPSYGDSRVPERPFPAVRVDPRAPIEAFGGGPGLEEANEAAKALADIGFRAQDDANAARMSEMRRALFDWEKANIHDPQTGARWKLGKDAIGIGSKLAQSFAARTTELEQGLANQSQREAFRGMVDARRGYLQAWADDHEGEQIRVHRLSEREAGIESSKERAAADPSTVPLEIEIVRDNVHDIGKVRGWGPEELAGEIRKHEGDFHVRVLRGMLAGPRAAEAAKYLAGVRGSIGSDDLARLDAAIQDVGDDDLAMEIEGEVFRPKNPKDGPPVNRSDAIGRAGTEIFKLGRGKDAKFNDKVMQRVKARWAEEEAGRISGQERRYEALARLQDANPTADPARLDPVTWQELPQDMRDALRRRVQDVGNDDAAWLKFMFMPREEMAALTPAQFEQQYWTRFDKERRSKAETRLKEARDAAENPEKREKFQSGYSDQEMLLRALKRYSKSGMTETDTLKSIMEDPQKAKSYSESFELFERGREEFHARTGKNPDDKEKKRIVNDALRGQVLVRVPGGSDEEKRFFRLKPEEAATFTVPFANIPEPDVDEIRAVLQRAGRGYSEDKASRIYRAFLLKDRVLVDQILGEP